MNRVPRATLDKRVTFLKDPGGMEDSIHTGRNTGVHTHCYLWNTRVGRQSHRGIRSQVSRVLASSNTPTFSDYAVQTCHADLWFGHQSTCPWKFKWKICYPRLSADFFTPGTSCALYPIPQCGIFVVNNYEDFSICQALFSTPSMRSFIYYSRRLCGNYSLDPVLKDGNRSSGGR